MLLALFAACAPVTPEIGEDPYADTSAPDIEVSAVVVDFGVVRAGDESTQVLTLRNVGTAELNMDRAVLQDPYGAFSVIGPAALALDPGEETELIVIFTTDTPGSKSASVLVPSDDPDEPTASITLVGMASDPAVAIDPSAYDFGGVTLGCADLAGFTITNAGDVDMTVLGVGTAGGEGSFAVDADEQTNGAFPWTLAPSESRVVWTRFEPPFEGAFSGTLVVYTDDPDNPSAAAALDGQAGDVTHVTESYTASGGTVDVLFALDGSSTFESEREDLADALPGLTEDMGALAMDYQVSVMLEENGCVVGRAYVEDAMTSSSRADALESMILDAEATALHGLDLFAFGTDDDRTAAGECNEGIVRGGDARLVLVGVTDGGERPYHGWDSYESILDELASDWVVHVIAPTTDCAGSAGTEWQEAVRDSDGETLSVCDDFADSLSDLVTAMAELQTRFPLSGTPDSATIEVFVDGAEATGWSFNTSSNTVVFADASAPALGSTVEIRYDAVPECTT